MGSSILRVEHLSKTFKSGEQILTVLDNISFSLEEGATCAIVGPSGSGKTTLIGLCAGLERPAAGSVVFNGFPLQLQSEDKLARIRNEKIGFVFQTFQLIPSLTALENVMVPAEIRGENHAKNRATELLSNVGLENRLRHYPAQLSGGEQQRVAIARAFMNRPKLLLADEPTGNLDLETGRHIIDLLFDLNRTTGATLMLVTHDAELTRRAARVIRLRGGVVVSDTGGDQESRMSQRESGT
jgi:putative ABC transport system ATP-binding protein